MKMPWQKEEEEEEEENFQFVKITTHVLKVHIHCEGCMHKIKKLLRKIQGVYEVRIEGDELNKVTVSGNVDSTTLINKLAKSGKYAELWPSDLLDNADYVNQMQTLINSLNSSGPQTLPTGPTQEDIDEWGSDSYLNDNHTAQPRMNNRLLGWREDYMSNTDDMEGSMRSAMNTPRSNGFGELPGLRNYNVGLPAYEYQHQLPMMMSNVNGSWYCYPYPTVYTNMAMHPVWSTTGNAYMHQPVPMMPALDRYPLVADKYSNGITYID